MKDISKKLAVINTGTRIPEGTTTLITQQYIGGGVVGMPTGAYLPQSVWNECFEIKVDDYGTQYLYGKLPMILKYGLSIYGEDQGAKVPSIAQGLPFDNKTIWYNPDTNQIEVIGGTGGGGEGGVSNFWDLSGIPSWITNSKPKYTYSEIEGTPDLTQYALVSQIPSLSGYATESWVIGKNYITSATLGTELGKYVTLDTDQSLKGKKDFKNGLSIDGLELRKSQDDVVYIDANLVVRGGVTMYAQNEVDIPSIIDSIPTASTTVKGIASFDGNYFSVDANGKVSLISGSGGIDENELADYLNRNNYAKKSDIPSLVGYATQSWVNTRIDSLINGAPAAYDTLKEIADVLQGNVNSIGDIITALGTKWTQDNTKIANWDTAYSWGNHANAGYVLKTYVDSELAKYVTLDGEQTISGKKNFTTGGLFVNGSQIIYDSTNKYWKLDGNLVVTGGITMYGASFSGGGAGATTLGQLQNVGNWADSVADVDRIMYQAAGSSNWVAKSLSSIGGGSFSGGVITGSGYNVLVVNRTDRNRPTIGFQYNGSLYGYLGFSNADYPVFISSVGDAHQLLHANNYSSYALPLSGGVLTSSANKVLELDTTGQVEVGMRFSMSSVAKGWVGYIPSDGTVLYNNASKATLGIKDDGTIHFNNNSIWHSGNFTPSDYLSLTGGTLTAPLKVKTATGPYIEIIRLGASSTVPYIRYSNEGGIIGEIGVGGGNSEKAYPVFWDGRSNTGWHIIWHSDNDGSGSGLDADLLDGMHKGRFIYHTNFDQPDPNIQDGNWFGMTNQNTPDGNYMHILSSNYTDSIQSGNKYWAVQLALPTVERNGVYIRTGNDGFWNGWYSLITSVNIGSYNVASATKLQTSRTIWGQWFDGSGNVSGDLHMYTSKIVWHNDANNYYIGCPGTTDGARLEYRAYSGHSFLGGNVGIGTTSPYFKLDVKGQSRFLSAWNSNISNETCSIIVGTNLAGITGYNSGIGFRALTDYRTPYINHNHAWIGLSGYESTTEAELYDLVFATNGSTKTDNYPTERMRILYNGNVGIGTTNPDYKLDVNGTFNCNSISTGGDSSVAKLNINRVYANTDYIHLYVTGGTNNARPLVLQNGYGNVGIGTTSPQTKLHVNGVIYSYAYGAIGSNNAAFVFEKPGNYATGIGANGETDTIYFGACYAGGNWASHTQTWKFGGNVLATGGVTFYSQRSLKNIVDERGLSLNELSTIKPTRYTWKDGRDNRLHFGGIADDIQQVLPEVVYSTSDGILTMDYGNAAFAVASSLINPVVDHEKRIAMLERENKELRQEVERLKSA